jgi:hypothetical protein
MSGIGSECRIAGFSLLMMALAIVLGQLREKLVRLRSNFLDRGTTVFVPILAVLEIKQILPPHRFR